jgi:hypothetical protein
MFIPLTPDGVAESLVLSAELVLIDHVVEPAPTELVKKIRDLGVPILGDIEGRPESGLRLAALVEYLVVPIEFASWTSSSLSPMDVPISHKPGAPALSLRSDRTAATTRAEQIAPFLIVLRSK